MLLNDTYIDFFLVPLPLIKMVRYAGNIFLFWRSSPFLYYIIR